MLHTCAIDTGDDALCWGLNSFGQLGDIAAGAFEWITVSGGQVHSCGIVSSGAAYCWGSGTTGQLGSLIEHSPQPSLVVGG